MIQDFEQKIAILILNYNSADLTIQNIKQVRKIAK